METKTDRGAQERGAGNRPRPVDAPAVTIDTRADLSQWAAQRPATTIAADPRVHPPGHKINSEDLAAGRDHYDGRAGKNAIRVTVQEAAILQGFPPALIEALTGAGISRTAQFRIVGNAVPPLLAKAILASLLETLA